MTPKSDNNPSSSKVDLPRLKASSSVRTVKGSKESAPDRSIFQQGENYLDRAAERRANTRQEAKSEAAQVINNWDMPNNADETLSVDGKVIDLLKPNQPDMGQILLQSEITMNEVQKQKVSNLQGLKPNFYQSTIVKDLCCKMGWDPLLSQSGGVTSPPRVEKFLPGRMVYLYDFQSFGCPNNTLPHTMFRNVITKEFDKTDNNYGVESPELISIVTKALLAKDNPPIRLKADDNDTVDSEGDIFPGMGEYVFEAGNSKENPKVPPALFERTAAPICETFKVPKAVENIITNSKPDKNLPNRMKVFPQNDDKIESQVDDYDECYPGVYESGIGIFDSDGEEEVGANNKPSSKRQQNIKERQKFEKKLQKVTKLVDERRKGSTN